VRRPKDQSFGRRTSGTQSCIIVHRSPGNELPGYCHGAPLGLTISERLVILTHMGVGGEWILAQFSIRFTMTLVGCQTMNDPLNRARI
jgi:hypothetical protein